MRLMTVNQYSDFCDELNFKWTSGILLLIISTIGVLRYVFLTSLITCWTPSHFEENHEDYVHQVCWSTENVYIPIHRKSQEAFHGKIPVILTLMLLGFQVPRLFKLLADVCLGRSAILVQETVSMEATERQINRLAEMVRDTKNQRNCLRTVFLLITKLLICINVLIQLVFLSTYFKDSVKLEVEGNVTMTHPVRMFPYIFLCDFQLRRLTNIDLYTVQCLMPANILYDNFFYCWWFWIIGVGVVSGLMFILQLASIHLPPVVRLRYRGVIPIECLSMRGCSMGDDLLMLTDIMNSSGQAMARELAIRVWGEKSRYSTSGKPRSLSVTESNA